MSVSTSIRRIEKPWGYELIWAETDRYVGKMLHVVAGARLSLQHHVVKDETLMLLSGSASILMDDPESLSSDGMSFKSMMICVPVHVKPGTRHRLEAVTDIVVVEVSTPELNDVVRHVDDYGR